MSRLVSRPHLRMRLTLLYGGLFLLAGVMLISLMYFLVASKLPSGDLVPPGPSASAPAGTSTGPDSHLQELSLLAERFRQLRTRVLDTFLQQSIIALAITTGAAVAFAWMIAGQVLRPLRRITETAQRVAERSLHERIALQGPPDELKELADTFDAMLERLDRAFDSQRRFVANASHEMRTPLAINRTLLEVALTYGDLKPELRSLHTTLLATNERSEHMVDGLLTLARSENHQIKRRPVDLADAAAYAVELTAAEASEAGITLEAIPDTAPTTGDPMLLERLALNLVQNGIRHNHRDGWVHVKTGDSPVAGWVELTVANTGPEIPPYDVDELFEPFRRPHGQRTANDRGVGLGLSIVRSVARTHGGDAQAIPRPGGGLVVQVRLPKASTLEQRTSTDRTPGEETGQRDR
jgi:signal transduction histidine kinase